MLIFCKMFHVMAHRVHHIDLWNSITIIIGTHAFCISWSMRRLEMFSFVTALGAFRPILPM